MTSVQSPMLKQLASSIQQQDSNAFERFWEQICHSGTPLIETGEDGNWLVTFLWKEADEALQPDEKIYALGGVAGWGLEPFQNLPETPLYYRTVRTEPRLPSLYYLSVRDSYGDDWGSRIQNLQNDKWNPSVFEHLPPPDSPDAERKRASIVQLPNLPTTPYLERQAGQPQGTISEHRLASVCLGAERRLWMYQPADCDLHRSLGLLLLTDGWTYLQECQVPTILHNLIATGQMPPCVAVFLDNPADQRTTDLIDGPDFGRYVIEEVLPFVRTHCALDLAPERTVIGGMSDGGMFALQQACQHPEIFGHVLSQSADLMREHTLHDATIPARVLLQYGTFERDALQEAHHDLYHQLHQSGTDVLLQSYPGGHESLSWREVFGDGLLTLLR